MGFHVLGNINVTGAFVGENNALQCGAEVTYTALPLPLGIEPIVTLSPAMLAFNPFMFALEAKIFPTALLSWELLNKM